MNHLDHPVAIYLSAMSQWEKQKLSGFPSGFVQEVARAGGLEHRRLSLLQQKLGEMGYTAVMVELDCWRNPPFSWKEPFFCLGRERDEPTMLMFDGMFWTGVGKAYSWDDLYRRKRIEGWHVQRVSVFSSIEREGGGNRAAMRALRREIVKNMVDLIKSNLEEDLPEARRFFEFVDDRLVKGLQRQRLARNADACHQVGACVRRL